MLERIPLSLLKKKERKYSHWQNIINGDKSANWDANGSSWLIIWLVGDLIPWNIQYRGGNPVACEGIKGAVNEQLFLGVGFDYLEIAWDLTLQFLL